MIDDYLSIKYKLKSSENFEEYLKALDIGIVLRKLGSLVSPVVYLEKEGSEYVLNVTSPVRNVTLRFKPGEAYTRKNSDGRMAKCVMTIQGDTLTENQLDGKRSKIYRTFSRCTLVVQMMVDDVKCTRIYERIN